MYSAMKVVTKKKSTSRNAQTKTYIIDNLGCANCAAKMEKRILELPQVEDATITFATKLLRLTADSPDDLIPEITDICNSIESGIEIKERVFNQKKTDSEAETPKKIFEETVWLWEIIIGTIGFISGIILEHQGISNMVTLPLFIIAYLILGKQVLLEAFRNLIKGQVFDENFLMSIATIGAFAISEYPEAVGVMLFYRIGELFEHKAVAKSRSQIMEAIDLRPETVNLILNKELQVIPAEEALVGDILLVRPGDRIPLDGTIIEGESQIDTSPVTGEPVPVKVGSGDEVISGCVNTFGEIQMRVDKPLSESMVSRILNSVENAAASKPVIERFITRFARVYTPFVIALALGTAIIPSIFSGNWEKWIYTALTFLVMSCPCALVLSVPLAFFSGIGLGSRKKILFKGGVSLEALKNIKTIVMDKTGTITEGNFILQEVLPADRMTADRLLALAGSCEQNSSHPIARSIMEACVNKNLKLEKVKHLREIAGQGISGEIDDIDVLCGNRLLLENHKIKLPEQSASSFGTEVFVAYNKKYIGRLVISDTIKQDASSSIKALKSMGLTTAMLTGDSAASAKAVANTLMIDEVHAKLLPQDKLEKLTQIRQNHGSVMFVGDGINDAPVLAGADVGAAMGTGADAAIEAADVVFMTSNMSAIPEAIQIARITSRIAWQNVIFALSIKGIVMILGLCGFASMWMAVFADSGVAMLCVLNSIRVLYSKNRR